MLNLLADMLINVMENLHNVILIL